MGTYLNPGKMRFQMGINSEIFVDKTRMITYINSVLNTNQRYVSVSRPRRFGKTMAADMLCAYYDREADSRTLFEKCMVSRETERKDERRWDAYLGSFDVIRLVMTEFLEETGSVDDMIQYLTEEVVSELQDAYPDVTYGSRIHLRTVMSRIYGKTNRQFVVIIDEWDAIFREFKEDRDGQKKYLDFLRDWLKDKEYIALAYITGILPIKKYGKHSALNMFDEYSMVQPMQLASYAGFTKDEVKWLCDQYHMEYADISSWYDGYLVNDSIPVEKRKRMQQENHRLSIYSPLSVVKAMRSGEIQNYWNETETYEALRQYIDWNFDGLKEDVAILMNGGRISVDISGYQNDMTTFHSKDDILTMLIHLGYLGYDSDRKELFVPNQEVLQVFKSSTKNREWAVTIRALENSRKLLEATWDCDQETVAQLIEAAHDKAGNRTYHSEAGLSYAVRLAYYAAHDLYTTVIPEMDTGKGYADLAFIPKKPDIPALLIELKYDENADTAIAQIHRQKYPDRLQLYEGNLILVGITYDRTVRNTDITFKHHSCLIEKA